MNPRAFPLKSFAWAFWIPAVLGAAVFGADPPGEKSDPCVHVRTSHGTVAVRLDPKAAPKTVENFLALAEGRQEFQEPGREERVKRPFYDGLAVHRVIRDFAIQTGCPLGSGEGGPGYRIDDEINADSLGLDRQRALPEGRPHPWLELESREALRRQMLVPLLLHLNITTAQELEARRDEVERRFASLSLKEYYELNGWHYLPRLSSLRHRRGSIAMCGSGPDSGGSQFAILLADAPHLDGRHTVFGEVTAGLEIVEKLSRTETDEDGHPRQPLRIESIRRVP